MRRPSFFAYWTPLVLAVLAIWADAWSTVHALTMNPDAEEGHPISAWLFNLLGGVWQTAAAMSIVLVLCALAGRRRNASAWAGSTLVTIFWLIVLIRIPVVLWNLEVARAAF